MAKPKAQTIQQRFGFMDDDLKKPKHDELMKWLNDSVDEKLFEWLGIPDEWTEDEISEPKTYALARKAEKVQSLQKQLDREKASPDYDPYTTFGNLDTSQKDIMNQKYLIEKGERISKIEKEFQQASEQIRVSPLPLKPSIRIVKKQWEEPVMSNDYIVGFVDMAVTFQLPRLNLNIELEENGWNSKWNIGYATDNRINFEVKTEIPSLGELIRQLNMYKSYGAKNIFVVAPDDSHKELLQEQGIGFIKYA